MDNFLEYLKKIGNDCKNCPLFKDGSCHYKIETFGCSHKLEEAKLIKRGW